MIGVGIVTSPGSNTWERLVQLLTKDILDECNDSDGV